jgi:hypothetical protein
MNLFNVVHLTFDELTDQKPAVMQALKATPKAELEQALYRALVSEKRYHATAVSVRDNVVAGYDAAAKK